MAERPADGFETWLAEKLWELVPPYHRHEDGVAEPPDALRRIVEVLAEQAAVLRRSQDRLWEDQSIEWCDPWAVPYIGELVGTRLISPLLPRGQRVDVAKTLYYRRRAGTPRVLEELIADITGWDGVVRESFRTLGRAPHGLDPAPSPRPFSGTLPGGLADLRRPVGAEATGGPFDEYAHTPDARPHRGAEGRHGIPKLAFHLYRLVANLVTSASPRSLTASGAAVHTFDPSGRSVPLFARGARWGEAYDPETWRSAYEWELPAPIRCRLLGHAEYELTLDAVNALVAAHGLTAAQRAVLERLIGERIPNERRLRDTLVTYGLGSPAFLRDARAVALVETCGKAALLASDQPSIVVRVGATTLGAHEVAAANLADPSRPVPVGLKALIDPERGLLKLAAGVLPPGQVVELSWSYGFSGPVGAGTYDRDGVAWAVGADGEPHELPAGGASFAGGGPVTFVGATGTVELADNRVYGPVTSPGTVSDVAYVAGDQARPYVRLANDLVITGLAGSGATPDAYLLLDGLWFGAVGAPRAVVLRGEFERVEVRCCTFDPGGVDVAGGVIAPVELRIEGFVERLVVQSSILGPVTVTGTGVVETLEMNDTIVDRREGKNPLALRRAEVHLERVTVLGDLAAYRLWASDTLVTGKAGVADTQNGCFRFSAAHADSDHGLPHPYESAFFSDAGPLFVSTTFGHPGYAQLSDAPTTNLVASDDDLDARASILTGAENDGEMGAFNALLNPIRERALRAKVEEFMPFGLLPLFIHET